MQPLETQAYTTYQMSNDGGNTFGLVLLICNCISDIHCDKRTDPKSNCHTVTAI